MPAPTLNATVVERTQSGTHNIILGVASDAGPLQFTPGQFVNLGALGPECPRETRAYSIASAPGAAVTQFALTLVDTGKVTPGLFALRPGDRVAMETVAVGSFTLRDVPADAPLLFVATGTGTAPFMSMLRSGLCKGRRVTVVQGARTQAGLAFGEELRANKDVAYHAVCSRDPDWRGETGHVQAVLEKLEPTPTDGTHALLCGNPAMIEDVRKLLEARGFKKHRKRDPGNLHFEAYW